MRFDTGSVPVGYLVLSSATKSIADIQDQALFKVRPLFSSLPGVSAPPPFGGSARSIVIRANPDRLRAFGLSPDDVIDALSAGNTITPSGNVRIGEKYPAVPTNAMVRDLRDLGQIPIKTGGNTVYLRDIGPIEDAADLTTGYALVNGRRAVYILATKRADASTMNVISEIKQALPKMQKELPDDIRVAFEFDQSPYVTGAIRSLAIEGGLGALLTGLMVILFLRSWRSALVVVLNIPLAILASIVGLWLTGQTINLMTLGGLALSVGILVDEATVEIENIHTQLGKSKSVAEAVWNGNHQTAVPRLLAMLSILAVFIPTFFMHGAPRELFAPLSLAVAFSMIASYLLSSTLVPILGVWWLSPDFEKAQKTTKALGKGNPWRKMLGAGLKSVLPARWLVATAYLVAAGLGVYWLVPRLGMDIFPSSTASEFRLRMRAPEGTHIDVTERMAVQVLDAIGQSVGPDNVNMTLGYVGTVPASFPVNSVYQFSRGPEEAIFRIALRPEAHLPIEELKETLRGKLPTQFPEARFSLEPADIISEVMSFGASAPIEVAVRGGSIPENRAFLLKLKTEMDTLPGLRDVQVVQALAYPTVDVRVDREKAGLAGTTMQQVSRSVLAATSSSRFIVPNYWPDPKTGIGYQVQIEIPQPAMRSIDELGTVPVLQRDGPPVLLRDVAQLSPATMPGQFDRYNMKRELSLTANIAKTDLGTVAGDVLTTLERVKAQDDRAKDELEKSGQKPGRITYELRGQIPPLRQMISGLAVGMLLALVAIFLMLSANYQSFRLALVTLSTAPAVLFGSSLALWMTHGTLNIQSLIGTIMSLGVAMANAILMVTFAEQRRRDGQAVVQAAMHAAVDRSRPVLMTSLAMMAGMLPMAVGMGEAGSQMAPLGRAVIGGLLAATLATLLILPAIWALAQQHQRLRAISLHPHDPT
jgi:multidrug efflux pump subunit AcrB